MWLVMHLVCYRNVINDEIIKMQCTLNIHKELFQKEKGVAYKYVVYSQSRECDEYINHVISNSNQNINRCLVMPEKWACKGNF